MKKDANGGHGDALKADVDAVVGGVEIGWKWNEAEVDDNARAPAITFVEGTWRGKDGGEWKRKEQGRSAN